MTSGVTVAASADGARMYVVVRGVDNRLHFAKPESGDTWPQLFSRTFATGGGGIACSWTDSGLRRRYRYWTAKGVSTSTNGGKDSRGDFTSIGVTSVALASTGLQRRRAHVVHRHPGCRPGKIWQTIVDVTDARDCVPKISCRSTA